jgi:hypothetical protein
VKTPGILRAFSTQGRSPLIFRSRRWVERNIQHAGLTFRAQQPSRTPACVMRGVDAPPP